MYTVLSGPNNGAVYVDGNFEVSHTLLQRGCSTEDIAKALCISIHHAEELKETARLEVYDIEVGDEPYLKDHGEFPCNSKLLVRNYWK